MHSCVKYESFAGITESPTAPSGVDEGPEAGRGGGGGWVVPLKFVVATDSMTPVLIKTVAEHPPDVKTHTAYAYTDIM